MKIWKQFLSLLLCISMLACCLPAPVFAEDDSLRDICEHHPECVDCGYGMEIPSTDCTHDCAETCTEDLCIHIHDEICGYRKEVQAQPCGFVCELCAAELQLTETVAETEETVVESTEVMVEIYETQSDTNEDVFGD